MNSDLPNFQCESYRRQSPIWQRLNDVYTGVSAWATWQDGQLVPNVKTAAYLRREPEEEDSDYRARLNQSTFEDKFAQAIRDFCGILFVHGIRFDDVPPIILDHITNIDNQGTHYSEFFLQLAIAAMRDGHTFVHVDSPPYQGESLSIYDAGQRRPYWVHVPVLDVPNWQTSVVNGQTALTGVTIEQRLLVPDGRYGETSDTQYLRLFPGGWYRSRIGSMKSSRGKKEVEEIVSEGLYGVVRGDRVEPLPFVPFVPIFGGDRVAFFESRPPLTSLASLNIAHYQIGSDHRQKMHLCCFPQPVVNGQMEGDKLVLGPRTVLILPQGGAFAWAEPRAESLTHSRQELQDIETKIDFLSASYLVKPQDRQAAMVSVMQANKLESSLYQFASSFVEGINRCLQVHAAYLGLSDGGRVVLSAKFLDPGKDPQLLLAYNQVYQTLETLPSERQAELLKLVFSNE